MSEFLDAMELVGWSVLRDRHGEARAFVHDGTGRLEQFSIAYAHWRDCGATIAPF